MRSGTLWLVAAFAMQDPREDPGARVPEIVARMRIGLVERREAFRELYRLLGQWPEASQAVQVALEQETDPRVIARLRFLLRETGLAKIRSLGSHARSLLDELAQTVGNPALKREIQRAISESPEAKRGEGRGVRQVLRDRFRLSGDAAERKLLAELLSNDLQKSFPDKSRERAFLVDLARRIPEALHRFELEEGIEDFLKRGDVAAARRFLWDRIHRSPDEGYRESLARVLQEDLLRSVQNQSLIAPFVREILDESGPNPWPLQEALEEALGLHGGNLPGLRKWARFRSEDEPHPAVRRKLEKAARRFRLQGKGVLRLLGMTAPPKQVLFSRDHVVLSTDEAVTVYEISGARERPAFSLPVVGGGAPTVAVAGGTLAVQDQRGITAFSMDGRKRFSRGLILIAALERGKKTFLLGRNDTHLKCLDAESGEPVWSIPFDGSRVAVGERVLVLVKEGSMRAIDPESGKKDYWEADLPFAPTEIRAEGGVVYLTGPGRVVGYDEVGGALVWTWLQEWPGPTKAWVRGGDLWAADESRWELHCVDLQTGKERWKSEIPMLSIGSFDLLGTVALLSGEDGKLLAAVEGKLSAQPAAPLEDYFGGSMVGNWVHTDGHRILVLQPASKDRVRVFLERE